MSKHNALNRDITMGSLLKFTLPSMIMLLFSSVYSIVDGIFAAHFIDTGAFAATNIVYPVLGVIIAIGTMFGTGATAIIATRLGEGQEKKAREVFSFIVWTTVVVGTVLSALVLLFLDPILGMLGTNDAIFSYCKQYALPIVIAFPAVLLQLQFQYYFVTNGKPNLGLAITVAGGLTNIILDYVFTVVLGWGIGGIALASSLGYCLAALIGLIYFTVQRKGKLYFVKPKFSSTSLVKSMTNGSSEMVSNLSTSITTLLFNQVMMHYLGENGVAAIAVVLYLDFILVAVSLGFSAGVAPLISYNYGAGNKARLKKLYRLSSIFSLSLGIVVTILAILFREPLTAILAPRNSPVFEIACYGLGIYALGYLLKGLSIFYSAMFTAFSNGKVSAILSFVRTLLFIVLSVMVLTWIMGVDGIWWSMPVAELAAFLFAIPFVLKGRKTYGYQ